jgi:hypothetical protein
MFRDAQLHHPPQYLESSLPHRLLNQLHSLAVRRVLPRLPRRLVCQDRLLGDQPLITRQIAQVHWSSLLLTNAHYAKSAKIARYTLANLQVVREKQLAEIDAIVGMDVEMQFAHRSRVP